MAVELASAYVTVIPTTKGIAAGLEKELVGPLNAAAKKGADEAGATMKKSLDDTGKSFTKFGIGGLAVAGALGAGLLATGKSASDLGESINAVQVTFGKAAGGILKLGEDAATAVGLSNAEFNGLAVQFSAFATTIAGKGGDVVQTMADMTGRAADFASVMNIDVAEAARLFQSGLAGETEPLKKFGIDLSAAAVSAFAASHGIGAMGKELTESEKVTARYQLLMESTAKTQGDFANTSDSAANSTRIAKAQLENASASLGAAFTPAMAFAATTVGSLAEKFVGLNDATGGWLAKGAGIAVVALAAASGVSLLVGQAIKLHDRFGLLRGALTNAEGGLKTFGLTARTATLAMGVLGIATVAATLFYTANAKKKAELVSVTNDFVEALNAEEDGQRGAVEAAVAKGLSDKKLIDQAAKLNLSVRDLAKIVNGEVVPAYAELQKQVNDADLTVFSDEEKFKAFDFVNSKLSVLNDGLEDAREQMSATAIVEKELGTATDDAGDSTEDLTDKTIDLTAAQNAADAVIRGIALVTEEAKRKSDAFAQSLVNQREKTEDLYGKEFDAIQAKHDLADATTQADADVTAMTATLKKHKEGTEEATAATDTAYDSIVDVAEQYGTLNGAALGSDSSIRRQIDSLTLQAGQLAPGSALRVALEQYIAELAEIPSKVDTQLLLNISIGQVATAAGDLIGIRSTGPGSSTPHARGGPASGRILVGEEGPEFLDVPPGSFVHTAQTTRAMRSATASLAPSGWGAPLIGEFHNNRRDIGVGDLNQILAMARLAA